MVGVRRAGRCRHRNVSRKGRDGNRHRDCRGVVAPTPAVAAVDEAPAPAGFFFAKINWFCATAVAVILAVVTAAAVVAAVVVIAPALRI